jgi:hypothetical protein
MASITVRKLDPVTWEPLNGNGQANFISDIDAVGQIIAQRLKLFEGEWWESLTEGLPLWQGILGYGGGGNNQQAINLLIQETILGTPFVTGLSDVQSKYNPSDRSYNFYAVAQTQFGAIVVTNIPTPPSRALPA